MKIIKPLAVGLSFTLCATYASAATIAVFGDRGERNVLAAELTAQGHAVTLGAGLPADLSSFDTIWHVGAFAPLTASVQTALSSFLAAGKGVFLTGERPCCDALNSSIQSLINANLASGSVQIGSLGDIAGPYAFNPGALGNIGAGISGWVPSAPGGISGVSGDNVLMSSTSNGTAVGAGWNDDDFINGGRAVVFMDVNWLSSINSSESEVIAATQEFLFDGFVGPNPDPDPDPGPTPNVVPLPAAGWMLLSSLLGLGLAARRRRA